MGQKRVFFQEGLLMILIDIGNTNIVFAVSNNNKIKIGFISTNFFNQSVSRDRMGIIKNLPRELFEVVVFFYFKPNDDLGNFIWNCDNTNIVLPDTNIFERRKIIEEQKLNILIYCDIGMAPDTYFLSY